MCIHHKVKSFKFKELSKSRTRFFTKSTEKFTNASESTYTGLDTLQLNTHGFETDFLLNTLQLNL